MTPSRMSTAAQIQIKCQQLQKYKYNVKYKYKYVHQIQIFVQGLAMPVVMVFGLVGNILSIMVLRSPAIDMKVTSLFAIQHSHLFFAATRRGKERKTHSAKHKNTAQEKSFLKMYIWDRENRVLHNQYREVPSAGQAGKWFFDDRS